MKDQRVPVEDLFANECISEKETLEQIKLGNNVQGQIRGLWYYNRTFAIYAIKCNDFEQAKRNFDTCGKLDEFQIKLFDDRLLDAGMENISYVLLSDNLDIINRYAHLGHSEYAWMVEHGHSTLAYAVQQSIIENWGKVQWCLDIMARKNQKLNKVLAPDRLYLEALMDMNKGKIEEALILLLKDHKKRNKYTGIAQDYISVPALGYAKLAWLKGIEVEIDHPLIPKELLPFKPLDHYEDKYDFLKSLK